MTRQINPTRSHTQGLKLAISAAAVAATLGGWAALTADAPPATQSAAAPAAVVAPLPAWLLEPPAIPTLQAVAPLQAGNNTTPSIASANVAQASAAPALRQVAAPAAAARPAPVTTTSSSR